MVRDCITEHTAASPAVLGLPDLSAWLPAYRSSGFGVGCLNQHTEASASVLMWYQRAEASASVLVTLPAYRSFGFGAGELPAHRGFGLGATLVRSNDYNIYYNGDNFAC